MKFKKYKLKDIGEVVGGATPFTSDDSNYDGDISWITPNDLSNHKSPYIIRGERNITQKGLKEIGNRLYPKGTVLFSSRAPIGYVAIAKKELCTNQGFKSVIPNLAYTTPEYLYYTLAFYKKHIENKGSGTTFKEVSGIVMENIELPFPSLENQERIADCLMSLDQKIALNTRMNAELEAMAKQLYDYWFVQFDFPDENGKPYKSSGGKMVWNEKLKRDIPEGWEVKEIGEIAEIVNGATPLTSDDTNYGNDIIWITPYDLSNQKNKFIVKGQRSISQKGYDSCSTTLLPKGSVLMSSRAPIGLLAIANTKLCTNQGFKSFVPNDMEDIYYLYYYLQTNMPQIEQLGAGTTFKEVSRNTMAQYSMLYVNDRCLYKTWSDKIKPIFNMQASLEKEINHLTRLRDSLLPMLMNGQVTIE